MKYVWETNESVKKHHQFEIESMSDHNELHQHR